MDRTYIGTPERKNKKYTTSGTNRVGEKEDQGKQKENTKNSKLFSKLVTSL